MPTWNALWNERARTAGRRLAILFFWGAILYTGYLGILNRGSKEMVAASLAVIAAAFSLFGETSLFKKYAAIVAFVAGFFVMFFVLKGDQVHILFSKSYFYERGSKRALEGFPGTYFDRLQEGDPILYTPASMIAGHASFARLSPAIEQFPYRDILWRQVLEALVCRYSQGWDSELIEEKNPFVKSIRSPLHPTKIVGSKVSWKFFSQVTGNRLLENPRWAENCLNLPPQSFVTVTNNCISIANPFVTVRMRLGHSSGVRGFGGTPLEFIFGEQKSRDYLIESHAIELEAEFSSLRSGHPEMPRYRTWVHGMFDFLQSHFDTSQRWESAIQEYIAYQVAPKSPEQSAVPVRPVIVR